MREPRDEKPVLISTKEPTFDEVLAAAKESRGRHVSEVNVKGTPLEIAENEYVKAKVDDFLGGGRDILPHKRAEYKRLLADCLVEISRSGKGHSPAEVVGMGRTAESIIGVVNRAIERTVPALGAAR